MDTARASMRDDAGLTRTLLRTNGAWQESAVLVGAGTLLSRATSAQTIREAESLLRRQDVDLYSEFLLEFYSAGLARFGDDWQYADVLTALLAATRLCHPASYLEVGVRRGRSLLAVMTTCPDIDVYALDMWIPGYAGMENPGKEYVREQARRFAFRGRLEFVEGNSHETLPALFRAQPDLTFELITVDGDHSREGALQDLRDTLPRLSLGGVVVFDDIVHPAHPYLREVWRQAVEEDGGLSTAEFTDLGFGVAIGVRQQAPRTSARRAGVGRTRRALSRVTRDLSRPLSWLGRARR